MTTESSLHGTQLQQQESWEIRRIEIKLKLDYLMKLFLNLIVKFENLTILKIIYISV